MKTQAVEFHKCKENDILIFEGQLCKVNSGSGGLFVKSQYLAKDHVVERVITQGPLTRLKRYLVG